MNPKQLLKAEGSITVSRILNDKHNWKHRPTKIIQCS